MSLTGGNRNYVTQLMPLIRAVPPVRGRPRQRPDAIYADRGYDHDKYRTQVRKAAGSPRSSPAGAQSMAPGWACTAGSPGRASPCCTGSAGCASAGKSAMTSTKPSSAWPAASSAGADWPTSHSVRSLKTCKSWCPCGTLRWLENRRQAGVGAGRAGCAVVAAWRAVCAVWLRHGVSGGRVLMAAR